MSLIVYNCFDKKCERTISQKSQGTTKFWARLQTPSKRKVLSSMVLAFLSFQRCHERALTAQLPTTLTFPLKFHPFIPSQSHRSTSLGRQKEILRIPATKASKITMKNHGQLIHFLLSTIYTLTEKEHD